MIPFTGFSSADFSYDFVRWAGEILNSNFSTAFFGAIAGSLSLFTIEWFGRQRKKLAAVNSAIAILGGLVNTYLMLKRQHVVPMVMNYSANRERFESLQTGRPTKAEPASIDLKQFYLPELHFDTSLESISFLAEKDTAFILVFAMARRAAGEVNNAFSKWNEVAKHCMDFQEEEDRFHYYFGLRNKLGVTNANFPDTIKNLQVTVDDALAFSDKTIRAIQMSAIRSLPFWLRGRINKFKIVAEEYRVLMPPKDYKADWN